MQLRRWMQYEFMKYNNFIKGLEKITNDKIAEAESDSRSNEIKFSDNLTVEHWRMDVL